MDPAVETDFVLPSVMWHTDEMDAIARMRPNVAEMVIALHTRIRWMVRTTNHGEPSSPSPPPIDHEPKNERAVLLLSTWLGAAIEYGISIPNTPLADARILRNRYETMRARAEYAGFMHRMSGLCTQQRLLDWLVYNDLHPMLKGPNMIAGATPANCRAFVDAYPDAEVPQVYLVVPMQEVPDTLLRYLPKYRGGTVHLPCYWKPVSEWLWQRRVSEMQRFYADVTRASWEDYCDEFPLEAKHLKGTAHTLIAFMIRKPNVGTPGGGGSGTIVVHNAHKRAKMDAPTSPVVDIGDMEDLWSVLPPCVQSLRNSHFPRNMERLDLTPILREGGLALDAAERLYATLNDCFPNGEDLRRRYNIGYEWQRAQHRTSVMCGGIIQNTLNANTDSLQCPFAARALEETGVANTRDNRPALNRRCNELCNSGRLFGGKPARLLQSNILAGKARPEPAVEVDDDTSSSDDDDD